MKFYRYAALCVCFWGISCLGQTQAQEVPDEIELAGIRLQLDRRAKRDVQNRVNLLLEDQTAFQKKVATADLFMPLIEDILEKAKLPENFKYLSLIDNTAPDSLIFWQMASNFASELGLEINTQVDERQNIIAATQAIAHYLHDNQEQLHNWMLTLLSYHLHTDGVKDYLDKNFPGMDLEEVASRKTFEVKAESHPDLLNFLALEVAFRPALAHDLRPELELISYQEAGGKSLAEVAQDFALPLSRIKNFNTWLKVPRVPENKPYHLIIPMPAASPSTDVKVYTTPNGELRYQTPEMTLMHVVERGETLYAIARQYQIALDDLLAWNKLSRSSVLSIGQKLIIISAEGAPEPSENTQQETILHTVKRGETLYRISRDYEVSIAELRAWNNLFTDKLMVGQKLKINQQKQDENTPPPPPPVKGNTEKPTPEPQPKENPTGSSGSGNGTAPENPEPTPPRTGPRVLLPKKVPNRLQVAGMQVVITPAGQKLIQKDVDLLIKSAKYFFQKLERVDIYLPLVEQELQEAGIPEDFKYLPIQESALIANAISRSNAVGYWQFKAASAQEVGLQINYHVDERMNIVASTQGASKYLKRNNLYYQNWLITLLSYNMGFTGAKNYVDYHYPHQDLRGQNELRVDEKTHWYIRKFIAHKIVFESEIGKELLRKKLSAYTEGNQKTLGQIAQETGCSEKEIKPYNLWLKRSKVPSDKTYAVIVPLDNL